MQQQFFGLGDFKTNIFVENSKSNFLNTIESPYMVYQKLKRAMQIIKFNENYIALYKFRNNIYYRNIPSIGLYKDEQQ